jgi:hypothetical protein
VTQAMVSDIARTLTLLSNTKSALSPQEEKGVGTPSAGAVSAKDSKPIPVDTISISSQSRQSTPDVKKEEAKKEETNRVNSGFKSDGARSKVQFVYDLKGNLSIRFMDTANRLIYQVPSELMLRLKEEASKSGSSVDTKA